MAGQTVEVPTCGTNESKEKKAFNIIPALDPAPTLPGDPPSQGELQEREFKDLACKMEMRSQKLLGVIRMS